MAEDRKTEYRRKKRGNSGAVAVMLTLIVLILFSTALLFLPEKETGKKKETILSPTPEATEDRVTEQEKLAVVLSVDTEVKMITVYNVLTEEEENYVYTGATGFFDGYGIQHTATQLETGELYRFYIDTKEDLISTGRAAVEHGEEKSEDGVWEKTGIDYMTITDEMISFRNQNYRYSKDVCVMNNGRMSSIGELKPGVDVVTVRGVGQVVYEIVVTKGHGYISLENHEDFVGGTITIGSTRVDTISQEALYLVREGSYMVNVSCDGYTGTEEIVVNRDETAVFDVYEYGRGPIQTGWLTVKVEPLGADLYIDGVKTAYTDGLELDYGIYKFEFTEGGYISYKATVEINQPKQSLNVYLTEQPVEGTSEDEDPTKDPAEENSGEDGETAGGEITGPITGGTQSSVSIAHLSQYTLDEDHVVYILGPTDAEIYLDGEYIGKAPIDFEKIIGSCVITVIRTDGGVKNFNYSETDTGEDSYYNFSWTD